MKIIVLLSLMLLFSLSCDNQILEPEDLFEQVFLTEEECYEIVNSEEYKEYFALKFEFLNRIETALESGFSASTLTEISLSSINENKHDVFYKVLFDNYTAGELYVENLINVQNKLYNKYPVLNLIYTRRESGLSENQISNFFNNLEERGINIKTITLNTKAEEIVCGSYWQQVKLLACAGLCGAATGGAGAVLCGWACWCMLCSENSAVADAIC